MFHEHAHSELITYLSDAIWTTWAQTVLAYEYMYIPCARPQRVDNMYLTGAICTTWAHTVLAYEYMYVP
ncbi:hypothetical protein NDU88_002014 [Pleurodeles waltl]|uniref:Uncharacterized protein n=1 Tax=Pleurodeles waltl TaxID=8319 RepID=A0AAV7Q4Q9_PLEWA|nr:hypothetical protein NDU88_002014 [Pleurodeles waltl]